MRQSFEVLQMKDHESIQEYISRVFISVNQIKGLGYKLSEEEVVVKVMTSLAPRFDHVVMPIKEARDV